MTETKLYVLKQYVRKYPEDIIRLPESLRWRSY